MNLFIVFLVAGFVDKETCREGNRRTSPFTVPLMVESLAQLSPVGFGMRSGVASEHLVPSSQQYVSLL